MQLDAISAKIRPRNHWEGVDLGFVMARQWFMPLWGLWWVTAAPVVLLSLCIYLVFDSTILFSLIVWWLKPLYEPMLLYWLSRRLFGEELSMREVMGEWRRILLPRLLGNLTLFRFSANRSFFMPVSHLERLSGTARRDRVRVLRENQSAGSWLTIVGVHIETILSFGILALVLFLLPSSMLPDSIFDAMTSEQHWIQWLDYLFWLVTMSLFAPFYVAGGFALYLTRRSQLEAWDLELAFRRMEPRFMHKRGGLSHSILASLLVAVMLLPLTNTSSAAELPSREESHRIITEVMSDKVFGTSHEEHYWRRISEPKEPKVFSPFSWAGTLATLLEYLAWFAVAVGVGLLIFHLSRMLDWLPKQQPRDRSGSRQPAVLFGMPINPNSLPDDVPGTVRQLLESGKIRQALSLLYRATLARLVHECQLRIPDSATESECRSLVAASRPGQDTEHFGRLTLLWIGCAYGHLDPKAEQIITLSDSWQGLYRVDENG
ncbi:MAG: hypothetical protein P8Z39_05675 [Gammaproteobacteria bacterium]